MGYRSYEAAPPQQLSMSSHLSFMQEQVSTCPPCPELADVDNVPQPYPPVQDMSVINCSINNAEIIECRRDGPEVYMPVSFINKFFDVYGGLRNKDNQRIYEFQYSYGKIYPPQPQYHPGGVFLNFEKYNVEGRDKIKCVSACDGVPLASQWDPEGYYYAISVAQYGLSHHAKGILSGNPKPTVVSSGNLDPYNWIVPDGDSTISIAEVKVGSNSRKVLSFNSPESLTSPGPTLNLETTQQTLCFDIYMNGPGGVTVKIRTKEGKDGYVHFSQEEKYMYIESNHVVYGMGRRHLGRWHHLARDLDVDWYKGLDHVRYNAPTVFHEIVEVTLHGSGYLDNVTLSSSAHFDHLIDAANWLVSNQDSAGGWPTSIGMRTGDIELKPGWYSAMGQGQAMSTLIRAYNLTGQRHYVDVAVKGLHLYELGSEEGGVRARFLGQLDWYEEYPTTPTSTFVLNGFIFSMMGLYDVMKTADGEGQRLAERLWSSGLRSLKIMLGMYDSGTGTLYDLRHVINHEQPNRARWDYHLTHIALIQEMAIIDGDAIFHQAASRWIDYLYGTKSKHN
ncbi:D-glucuronyl C5-epimerase B-like [Physella acuta]|uniref:D-glucuronyl C5-epimerase B-like n=1 Tax=Physella acuta TaxID=109671 RepID=UPI0027DC8C34|nr:D-glucuronyl C5-epimerase B-like [Physella acuta]